MTTIDVDAQDRLEQLRASRAELERTTRELEELEARLAAERAAASHSEQVAAGWPVYENALAAYESAAAAADSAIAEIEPAADKLAEAFRAAVDAELARQQAAVVLKSSTQHLRNLGEPVNETDIPPMRLHKSPLESDISAGQLCAFIRDKAVERDLAKLAGARYVPPGMPGVSHGVVANFDVIKPGDCNPRRPRR